MSHTKRISKRTRTSLKKADTSAIQRGAPVAGPSLTARARAARVEAVREVINAPDFDLDASLAKAVTRLIEREIG
jgi:hypothetical protein